MEFDEYQKKINEISDTFNSSTLGGMSISFLNGVSIFINRNRNESFDCISEMITTMEHLIDELPYSAEIQVKGIQFIIKTKEDISRECIRSLMDNYLVQGTDIPSGNGKEDFFYTTIFTQTPDWFDDTFEEFLKTYPEFLQKKYVKIRKTINKGTTSPKPLIQQANRIKRIRSR